MVKTLERALEEIGQLPTSDQERIGAELLEHVEKLRALRAAIDEGIRSLDAGEGRELDVEEFLAQLSERHAKR